MDIDFERLRKVYRMEKAARSRLTRLEPDFYELLRAYIEKELEDVKKAWEEQDIRSLILFSNLQKLVREFIDLRQRKIIDMAVRSAMGEEWEPENLVGYEKEFYEEIKALVQRYRERALELAGLVKREEHKEERREEEKPLNVVRIRILKAIPEFIGTDFNTYGPYAAGEIVDLPADVADILLVRNLAEVVKDEEDPHAQVQVPRG